MDQIDVATLTTAVLILFFFFQARQLVVTWARTRVREKAPSFATEDAGGLPLLWRGT